LRIWVSNTVEDQVWQSNGLNVDAFDFTPNLEASFRVKIRAALLDNQEYEEKGGDKVEEKVEKTEGEEATASDSKTDAPKDAPYRFSHFFKSITVDFDSSRFRNGAEQIVEWKKPETGARNQGPVGTSTPEFDEFAFKRNGDENMNITIKLYRHEVPERYQLSPELAEVVDMTEATQQEAVMGLWEYVRMSGLQEDEEKRNFRCDDLLKKVCWIEPSLHGIFGPLTFG
jgi:chromatin remodeling complex protein RSC6